MESGSRIDDAKAALAAGHLDEAAHLCEEALDAAPGDAELLALYDRVMRSLDRPEMAQQRFFQALETDPTNIEALRLLAQAYVSASRIGAALRTLALAVKIAPLELNAQADYADLLLKVHEVDEAESVVRLALAFEPAGYQACRLHNALGHCLWRKGRGDEAMEAFQRAITFAQNNDQLRFTALSNIMATLQSLGRLGDLRKLCMSLLTDLLRRGNPLHATVSVLFQLSLIDAIPDGSELQKVMRGLLDEPNLSEDSRAHLHFALARIAAKAKRHDEAFEHYRAGGAAKRASVPGASVQRDLEEMEVQRRIFTPELVAHYAGVGLPAEEPVFIVGMPRSGTTLIEQVLAAHAGVAAAGELPDMALLAGGQTPMAPAACMDGFPAWLTLPEGRDVLRAVAGAYLYKVRHRHPGALRIVDKMPVNFVMAGAILLAFPKARIIHARRNPLDTCVACFTTLFETDGYTSFHDLTDLGRYHRGYMDLMAHWHALFPGRILDVHYEDMVTDLEGQSRRLMDYVELPWTPDCLTFHDRATTVRTASFAQVRQPVFTSSIGRWRIYEKHLGPLIAALDLPESALQP